MLKHTNARTRPVVERGLDGRYKLPHGASFIPKVVRDEGATGGVATERERELREQLAASLLHDLKAQGVEAGSIVIEGDDVVIVLDDGRDRLIDIGRALADSNI